MEHKVEVRHNKVSVLKDKVTKDKSGLALSQCRAVNPSMRAQPIAHILGVRKRTDPLLIATI